MTKIIAVANQKGGVGKTTTTVNLGICLANRGNHVLLIDADPQGNLTESLGWRESEVKLPTTLATIINKVISDEPIAPSEGILHHAEGVDVVPSNIALAATEVNLINAMSREFALRTYFKDVAAQYDYILIDCMPSLGMLTINALAAADSVIIPVQAQYLSAIGMNQLMQTIARVKRQINPNLQIEGVVMTMMQSRTTHAREVANLIHNDFGSRIRIFNSEIPYSTRAAETSAEGMSIFAYDPRGKIAEAYQRLTQEVCNGEKQYERSAPDLGR